LRNQLQDWNPEDNEFLNWVQNNARSIQIHKEPECLFCSLEAQASSLKLVEKLRQVDDGSLVDLSTEQLVVCLQQPTPAARSYPQQVSAT
jgi:hypothetical protein